MPQNLSVCTGNLNSSFTVALLLSDRVRLELRSGTESSSAIESGGGCADSRDNLNGLVTTC